MKFVFKGEIDVTHMTEEAREQFFTMLGMEIRGGCQFLSNSNQSVRHMNGDFRGGVYDLKFKAVERLDSIPEQHVQPKAPAYVPDDQVRGLRPRRKRKSNHPHPPAAQ